MKGLKLLLSAIITVISIISCYSQVQLLSTKGGKNCRVFVEAGSLENNIFDVFINTNWVTKELNSINDTVSIICIDRNQFIKSLPKSIRLISPNDSRIISFNSKATLKFEIDEMFQGGDISFSFPFAYAINKSDVMNPEAIQEFYFKRPRSYLFSLDVPGNLIIHKIPPRITIISPEGVEEGMKPIVDTPNIKIQLCAWDVAGIDRISINNIPAAQIDDSTFFADINLKVGFENPILVTAFDKKGLSTQKQFAIECRKAEIKMIISGPAALPSKNRKPSDVDIEVPDIAIPNANRFALIIGNEDYSAFQPSLKTESNVEFAIHDAEIFKEYSIKIIGIPDENIIMVLNAKAMEMHRAIGQINSIIKNMQGNAELYVFYAGHGFPDEVTKESYLIPVDVTGTDLQFAIKQTDFFKKITEYPAKRVVVFLDACFSGGGRNQSLLAARGVKIKPKENPLKGNLVVFSASSGEQSSLPYDEKEHGLFTYFLLKKLKDTLGNINLEELSDYLTKEVGVRSVMVNNKEQNPQTSTSFELGDTWKNWSLK